MTGYALPAPRIGEEGLPVILAVLAVSGLAIGGLVYWGMRNKAARDAKNAALQATR